MKRSSVPDSLVTQSFREGLCSETSSRSRQQPKENAQEPSCIIRAVSFYGGFHKDELLACAKAFENLLTIKYYIIIGRKGKSVNLNISFEAVEFHHLAGLHKLHDLRLSRANREKIFYQILSGHITLNDIKKSRHFCNIQNRLAPFQKIEELFDKNDLIFRYNQKIQSFSLIEAEYLLSTPHECTDVYIFLDKKDDTGNFFCRSFFPKEDKDYTQGQAVFTLLKKEKINSLTDTVQIQYDRLSPKRKTKPISTDAKK